MAGAHAPPICLSDDDGDDNFIILSDSETEEVLDGSGGGFWEGHELGRVSSGEAKRDWSEEEDEQDEVSESSGEEDEEAEWSESDEGQDSACMEDEDDKDDEEDEEDEDDEDDVNFEDEADELKRSATALEGGEGADLIRSGQWGKLKVVDCQHYLRMHGLKISGLKADLIARIKEHQSISSPGEGRRKYPPESFSINCKGDVCKGDVVLFMQRVYEERQGGGWKRKCIGSREVAGRVLRESYGSKTGQHTFTIEVLWSEGLMPLPPMRPLLIKGRNLYRLKTRRQVWSNEHARVHVLKEKHERGQAVRALKSSARGLDIPKAKRKRFKGGKRYKAGKCWTPKGQTRMPKAQRAEYKRDKALRQLWKTWKAMNQRKVSKRAGKVRGNPAFVWRNSLVENAILRAHYGPHYQSMVVCGGEWVKLGALFPVPRPDAVICKVKSLHLVMAPVDWIWPRRGVQNSHAARWGPAAAAHGVAADLKATAHGATCDPSSTGEGPQAARNGQWGHYSQGARPAGFHAALLHSQLPACTGLSSGARPAGAHAAVPPSHPPANTGLALGAGPGGVPAAVPPSQPPAGTGLPSGARPAGAPAAVPVSQPPAGLGFASGTRPAGANAAVLPSQPPAHTSSSSAARPAGPSAALPLSQPPAGTGLPLGARPGGADAAVPVSQPPVHTGSSSAARPAGDHASVPVPKPPADMGSSSGARPAGAPPNKPVSRPPAHFVLALSARPVAAVPPSQPPAHTGFHVAVPVPQPPEDTGVQAAAPVSQPPAHTVSPSGARPAGDHAAEPVPQPPAGTGPALGTRPAGAPAAVPSQLLAGTGFRSDARPAGAIGAVPPSQLPADLGLASDARPAGAKAAVPVSKPSAQKGSPSGARPAGANAAVPVSKPPAARAPGAVPRSQPPAGTGLSSDTKPAGIHAAVPLADRTLPSGEAAAAGEHLAVLASPLDCYMEEEKVQPGKAPDCPSTAPDLSAQVPARKRAKRIEPMSKKRAKWCMPDDLGQPPAFAWSIEEWS